MGEEINMIKVFTNHKHKNKIVQILSVLSKAISDGLKSIS